jgi:hypothetical protein
MSHIDTSNPQRKAINQKSGPRTGCSNPGDKRAEFKSAKAERAPLASMIQNAYKARTAGDYVDPRYESIESTVPPRKFKR